MQIKAHDSTWDVLRTSDNTWIVRNDLKEGNSFCLKFSKAAGEGGTPEILNVCTPLSGADHYLGKQGYFYCIKDDEYLRVSNIETGADLETAVLHEDMRSGIHYFQKGGSFYCLKNDWSLWKSDRLSKKPTKYQLSPKIQA